MFTRYAIPAFITLLGLGIYAGTAQARDQIHVVGSSTVFPFTSAAAEQFGRTTAHKAPLVESNGTGIGMKMFCAGVGPDTPDFTDASRRIKSSETELCTKNGVTDIEEIRIGFDGIVLGNSKDASQQEFTIQNIFLALAKHVPVDGKLVDNPYQKWSEINPTLPAKDIAVYGPTTASGTRDAFVELVMEKACKSFPEFDAAYPDKKTHAIACKALREDGGYIEVGEQDNVTVKKVAENPDALGIFGFSYYDQNTDIIQASLIGGIEPTFESIESGDYPVSRSLFVYMKRAHLDLIPGMKEYARELTSEAALSGEDGYLADKGLIPLPEADREAVRSKL